MNKSEVFQKVGLFYEKLTNDKDFANRARSNAQQALAECGLDIDNHKVSFEVKIDDELVHHFVIPRSGDDAIKDEEMNNINAAKSSSATNKRPESCVVFATESTKDLNDISV